MGLRPPMDARLSVCPSLQPDLPAKDVQLHFSYHDYQNILQACVSVIPQSSLQGPRIDAFIAGKCESTENLDTLTVLFARAGDTMVLDYIYSAKLILTYSEMHEIPSLLHQLCSQVYGSTIHKSPMNQYKRRVRQTETDGRLVFSAIPGIGRKKADLLHKEYGTLRNFIGDLHRDNSPPIFKIFASKHLARLRALFTVN